MPGHGLALPPLGPHAWHVAQRQSRAPERHRYGIAEGFGCMSADLGVIVCIVLDGTVFRMGILDEVRGPPWQIV